ncbi:MAG: hypothetical protein ABFR65_09960 [Pseudomonadota bacterium]
MDNQFEKLIEINISGRVFAICQSRRVVDPTIIGYYTDILRKAVQAHLNEECSPTDFNRILAEQAVWLESEIDQMAPPGPETRSAPTLEESPLEAAPQPEESEGSAPRKRPSGYIPQAKSMPERLADQRSGMEHLLEKDCVTLKLITPGQAKLFKRRLLGQEPEKAEQELVAELRNILHGQVRKFIRKNAGGPWDTATLQHELRMDIVSTRTLRSLVTLARELLMEREQWLQTNKNSLSGRLFGGKIRFNK